jgi:molecular chaperone IbpA
MFMRTLDLTPLFRSSVGFDRFSNLFDTVMREDNAPSYPPYNIEKLGEDDYRIVIALAGFKEQDLEISAHENMLTVRGTNSVSEEKAQVDYLYKGIATRSFERKFSLADHVRVTNASLADGLLTIDLVREVPEAQKPRTIAINGKEPKKTIENKKVN